MNGLTELERQQQQHKSRLFPSLQDKYLPVFFYFISAILIVFDFSLSLRRLSPPGCCCINVGTRNIKKCRTYISTAASSLCVCLATCRRRECGLTIRQMYILFVVMIWQSNEIFFSLGCCCWFRLPNEISTALSRNGRALIHSSIAYHSKSISITFFLSFDSIHRLLYEMRFKMAWEGFNIDTNV